jgi:hypothetical protein
MLTAGNTAVKASMFPSIAKCVVTDGGTLRGAREDCSALEYSLSLKGG